MFGAETDFFGAYWHDDDFGMVRYAPRDEKAGKKIWIWGLSRQGMIWEQLLTDSDGQYSEVQSGRLFNQSAEQSTFTPFKHRGFAPHTVDRWTEYWYPVVGTKGFVTASRIGALNVTPAGDRIIVTLSPVVPLSDTLAVYDGARRVHAAFIARKALSLFVDTIPVRGIPRDSLRITIGGDKLEYRADAGSSALARPLDAPAAFDWHSAYGLYLRGKEWLRQRSYDSARAYLDSALARDPYYVPALADRSMLAIRATEYDAARTFAMTALSVDTYDGAANYYYALANRSLGRLADAKDGFEVAASSPEFRAAAWTELARMASARGSFGEAAEYAGKALDGEAGNLDALGIAAVAARHRGDGAGLERFVSRMEATDPLSHQARLERLLAAHDTALAAKLVTGIHAELPGQVLLELEAWYAGAGDTAVALQVLEAAGSQPEALYTRAYLLDHGRVGGSDSLLALANRLSPRFVFPFRPEVVPVLQAAVARTQDWKPRYYLALAYWGCGRIAEADSLLNGLGDTPDYAPFYAARASFAGRPTAGARSDLERATNLDASEWRYGRLLSEQLLASGNATAAADVARRYYMRFPANYILGLTLAKALVAAGGFSEADALLSLLEVLPYEGARDGHTLYRQAKLMLAVEAIGAKKWDVAGQLVAAARQWPERLGVGRPYDADVDERLEDFLGADIQSHGTRRTEAAVKLAQWPDIGTSAGTDAVVLRAWMAIAASPAGRGASTDSLRYGVGTWEPDSLGNHRAVVRVAAASDAVFAHIPWRRRDMKPENVDLVVIAAATQRRVLNVARMDINREFGDIVFEADAPGEYYIYYMPYTGTFKSNYPKITYRVPAQTADGSWLVRHALGTPHTTAYRSLPAATMVGFDAVNEFSRFTPMEYIAGAAERDALRARNPSAAFLAFAEDRSLSIRMAGDIPHVWAERGAFQPFTGDAQRGEFYTFQVGVWAHRSALDSLRYRASAFTRKGGTGSIPASSLTAFNLEGTDWSGRRFTRALHVDSGRVQALWFGVDVPAQAAPGEYEGRVTLSSRGTASRDIPITIRVGSGVVANHGDDDPARLTRLRWLNSQLAADDSIVAPYTAMRVTGSTISLLGRSFTFGPDGMPASIKSFFTPSNTAIGATAREILSGPARLAVRDSAGREIVWTGTDPVVTKRAVGVVAWQTDKAAGSLRLRSRATLEFDGTAEYQVALKAVAHTSLADVRLEIPLRADAARYMMGLGQKGGYRPEDFHWTWDVAKKNQDAAWIGDVNAGLQFTLKDEHYVRPLNTNFYLSKPLVAPRSWANDGKGRL